MQDLKEQGKKEKGRRDRHPSSPPNLQKKEMGAATGAEERGGGEGRSTYFASSYSMETEEWVKDRRERLRLTPFCRGGGRKGGEGPELFLLLFSPPK